MFSYYTTAPYLSDGLPGPAPRLLPGDYPPKHTSTCVGNREGKLPETYYYILNQLKTNPTPPKTKTKAYDKIHTKTNPSKNPLKHLPTNFQNCMKIHLTFPQNSSKHAPPPKSPKHLQHPTKTIPNPKHPTNNLVFVSIQYCMSN